MTPNTARTALDLFGLSARHVPPFQPKDVGFRDAFIFWSVVDHLRTRPRVAGLLAADKIFRHVHTLRVAGENGVRLETFERVNDVVSVLEGRLSEVRRREWERDRERARAALTAKLDEMVSFLARDLVVTSAHFPWAGRLVEFKSLGVMEVVDVTTPFPPERRDGQEVSITATVEVELVLLVERPLVGSWPSIQGVKRGESVQEPEPPDLAAIFNPRPEPALVRGLAEIQAVGVFRGGEYSELRFLSAVLREPELGPLSRALATSFQVTSGGGSAQR